MASPSRPFQADALHECHDCGLFQSIGLLRPGQVAACDRCGAVLRRRRRNSLSSTLALALGGLLVMLVGMAWPLMTIRITGQERVTTLLHLPVAFETVDMPVLAIAVLATTLAAPLLRLGLTVGVIAGLRTNLSHAVLVAMARLRAILQPWAMIEVFMLGLFVAYTRLEAIATVEPGVALYALGGLMLLIAWMDAWLDDHAMWEAIGQRGPAPVPTRSGQLIGCDACGLANRGLPGDGCERCATPLRHRKPQSFTRTWALLLTAAVLYVPANLYPVLTVIRLGRGAPSTILGGVVELIEYRMWPLAALVFLASILVPVMKLIGLAALLIMAQRGSAAKLYDRTRLYRLVDFIGRWSMIDVFMVAILTALVRMDRLASVTPGYGAVAFACVVVLTMLAAISFDPRLMWDYAGENGPEPAATADRPRATEAMAA
ncbi:MAG: paraquat-inducible protein A [Janthinobacterium lividum]